MLHVRKIAITLLLGLSVVGGSPEVQAGGGGGGESSNNSKSTKNQEKQARKVADILFSIVELPGINGLCPSGCGLAKKNLEAGDKAVVPTGSARLNGTLGKARTKQDQNIHDQIRGMLDGN